MFEAYIYMSLIMKAISLRYLARLRTRQHRSRAPRSPVKQKIHLKGCRHVDIEEMMEEASKADGLRSERDMGLTLV
jgi:hypothetical protein